MESKRDILYDIINDACSDSLDKWDSHLSREAGIYGYADQIEELFDSEVEQNATLIEQNEKLRSSLEFALRSIKDADDLFSSDGYVIENIERTLKDTENGK